MGSPGFNWRDALSAGFQGVAGAAGNQQLYDQIQQQRDQKKQQADAMRQASLTKIGFAQKKVNDMLVSGVHPETGAPISEIERGNLSQTAQTLKDYAHQIATGQPPPKQSAPPAAAANSAPAPQAGAAKPPQPTQDPRQAVAQYTAEVPANPYAQKYNQVRQAFPNIEPEEAMHMALGTTPKSLQEKLIAQWEKDGLTPEQALQKYTDITKPDRSKDKTPKGMKVVGLSGIPAYVHNEDTGESYYPDAKGNFPPGTPPDAISAFGAEGRSAQAKEARDKLKEMDHQLFEEKMTGIREAIHDREQELSLSSRIPAAEANRYTQAQIIQEQTNTLRQMLQDPEIQSSMGPVAGRTIGAVKALYSQKIRDFYATQKSLSSLLPLLHGYRGGVQTQQSFDQMSGNMHVDPKAYLGVLDALDATAGNVMNEVQQDYPSAPMFNARKASGTGNVRKQQTSGAGSSSDPSQRKVGDVKKFPNGKTGVWDGKGWVAQ
jgi:hypothetical protein